MDQCPVPKYKPSGRKQSATGSRQFRGREDNHRYVGVIKLNPRLPSSGAGRSGTDVRDKAASVSTSEVDRHFIVPLRLRVTDHRDSSGGKKEQRSGITL